MGILGPKFNFKKRDDKIDFKIRGCISLSKMKVNVSLQKNDLKKQESMITDWGNWFYHCEGIEQA